MNWIKKLWGSDWLVIRINQKLILVLIAAAGLYASYSWGYTRGFNRVLEILKAMQDEPASDTKSST